MTEELKVVLARSSSEQHSGFGFSLLGTTGPPHVIYDIVENSPAADCGAVSNRNSSIQTNIGIYMLLWNCKNKRKTEHIVRVKISYLHPIPLLSYPRMFLVVVAFSFGTEIWLHQPPTKWKTTWKQQRHLAKVGGGGCRRSSSSISCW